MGRNSFDILKPTKSGAITLTRKWLQDKLNLGENDFVLEKKVSDDMVILMRFNPEEEINEQLKQAYSHLGLDHESGQGGHE